MAIHRRTCFVVGCDECSTPYEHDYIPHFDSRAEAKKEVVDAGWEFEKWEFEGKLRCPSCVRKHFAVLLSPEGKLDEGGTGEKEKEHGHT